MGSPIVNPWLDPAPNPDRVVVPDASEEVTAARVTPATVHPGIELPSPDARLPRREVERGQAVLWSIGAHGGSGESTLAQLLDGSMPSGHTWPICSDLPVLAVLVARTHAAGLTAAQAALAEAAAGLVPVRLLGLVLVADAPGRLPRPLRELAKLVAGGSEQCWMIPWVEAWRLGEQSSEQQSRTVRKVVEEISRLAAGHTTEKEQ
jgi:hypothetical protein